jgi:L-amino acid N-acyltransferase YncA
MLITNVYNFLYMKSGIFPESSASIKLHKACGFKKIGYREK